MGRLQRTNARTAILVDRVTTPLIKAHDILMEGCAQFVTLQSSDNGTLTIINIYAQRSSNDRAPLWRRIIQAKFTADHVIVGGDFNHLEETDCRGISGERQMHRRKVAAWNHMTLRYGLVDAGRLDSFRKMSKKEFTYDNGRSGARLAVSRIDKFLVSQDIDETGGRIEAAASVRKLSDHSPLLIMMWGHPPPPPPPLTTLHTFLTPPC
jgi:exonuclease III